MSDASNQPTNDYSIDAQTIEYAEGQTHGVDIYVQLDDGNKLYDLLTDAQRELNNERGENAGSDNPHYLGDIDASWTEDSDEVGFFSTRVEYGQPTSNGFTSFYAQVLNLYESVSDANIASNPAKRRVEVHKRTDGLEYEDGNEYTWPSGWLTGERHEGTLLKIQCSYVENPGNAIADVFELVGATNLLSGYDLRAVKQPIVETVRFSGLESHHRIHKTHEKDAIETVRDSARLVSTEGDGRIHGDIEKGHHQIYGVDTTRIDGLGFDPSVEYNYRGETFTDEVGKHYLKVYRHRNAELYPESNPLAHPKIEVKAHGAYPGPAWNAVKRHLDTILNAHTSDWTGIPTIGLVVDDFHDGDDQPTIRTQSPTEYRINLQDYFKSDGLKKQIVELLVNNRTNSAKDILYTVIRLGRPASYDELKEETGLTKRTIRKWVARMEKLAIVERKKDACMFVCMADFVRKHLRKFLEAMKPVGDIKRAIRQRKREREASRSDDSQATETGQTVATDGGVEMQSDTPPHSEDTTTNPLAESDTHDTVESNPPPD